MTQQPIRWPYKSGLVLVEVGREDMHSIMGLGQMLRNIIFLLAFAWNHSFAFGGFLRHWGK